MLLQSSHWKLSGEGQRPPLSPPLAYWLSSLMRKPWVRHFLSSNCWGGHHWRWQSISEGHMGVINQPNKMIYLLAMGPTICARLEPEDIHWLLPPAGLSIPTSCSSTLRLSSCKVANPASKCLLERDKNLISLLGVLFSASVAPACHNMTVESCKFNKQWIASQNKVGDKRVDWFREKEE